MKDELRQSMEDAMESALNAFNDAVAPDDTTLSSTAKCWITIPEGESRGTLHVEVTNLSKQQGFVYSQFLSNAVRAATELLGGSHESID